MLHAREAAENICRSGQKILEMLPHLYDGVDERTRVMNLKLEIRRNADGAVVVDVWPEWEFNVYWWEHGNASCDCNRELFFLKDENAETETICSDGRYSVRLSDANTGEVLYDELGVIP